MRRVGLWLVVLLVALAGCGDDDAFDTTTAAPVTTTGAGSSTTGVETTTTTPSTTTTATTTTTTAPPRSAAGDLAAFFAAAEALDGDIKAAAAAFNAGFDADAGTLDPSVAPIVDALDARPLGALIPAGLSLPLETSVLAAFTGLDSRIAALAGGVRYLDYPDKPGALDCLEGGGQAAARFPGDLAAARALADDEAPPSAAPDSEAAGILAVRLTAIHSMNWGCDSCGGLVYDGPIEVDWPGRTVAGVEFEATFSGGSWDILIYAC
jgi:hypothetical protein